MSREFRRALAYLVPYWRQLAVVVLLSGLNTALTLTLPYLTMTLVEARQVISVMVKAWMNWLHAGRPPIP